MNALLSMGVQLSRFKAFELIMFDLFPCILHFDIDWTFKSSGQDHWGFAFIFCIIGLKIVELNIYDIRHQPDEEE